MKKHFFILMICFAFFSCKQKEKEKSKAENFFPVLSFIKSQVAHVDTSFYPIIKLTGLDTMHIDTTYVRREDFRGLAKDFLEIPDITDKKIKALYKEENFYDESLNTVVLTYLPKDSVKAIVQRQEVLIIRGQDGDKVKTFIIDVSMFNKDSSVEKKMLWQVDKSFQVFSTVQKPDQSEISTRFKVIWNKMDNE